MTTRSGKTYKTESKLTVKTIDDNSVPNNTFTNLHILYYSMLYEKLINSSSRQTLAIYNLENYNTCEEKFQKLKELEKLVKAMK